MRPAADLYGQAPVCTVAVPSLNQGAFLDRTLQSIFDQQVPLEVMLMDGGSTDVTAVVIAKWQSRLTYWRTGSDDGQAAAINEGIYRGCAPYVMWLNSDDILMSGALSAMLDALDRNPSAPATYGRARIIDSRDRSLGEYRTHEFDSERLARRCFIAQPATLIRRSAWQAVGGIDARLSLAFDFDLWWRLYRAAGPFVFVDRVVAGTRAHRNTKTLRWPIQHYREALRVVSTHYGRVPWLWYAKAPLSIGWRVVASAISLRAR